MFYEKGWIFDTNTSGYVSLVEGGEDKAPGVLCSVSGPFLMVEEDNINDRFYTADVVDDVILGTPYTQKMLARRTLFGSAHHPEKFSVDIPNTSHNITALYWQDDQNKKVLWGEADILDTPYGQVVHTLLKYGSQLGVSVRAKGTLRNVGGKRIPDKSTYIFRTFDIVQNPSFTNAVISMNESGDATTLDELHANLSSVAASIIEGFEDVKKYLPVTGISEDGGDVTTMDREKLLEEPGVPETPVVSEASTESESLAKPDPLFGGDDPIEPVVKKPVVDDSFGGGDKLDMSESGSSSKSGDRATITDEEFISKLYDEIIILEERLSSMSDEVTELRGKCSSLSAALQLTEGERLNEQAELRELRKAAARTRQIERQSLMESVSDTSLMDRDQELQRLNSRVDTLLETVRRMRAVGLSESVQEPVSRGVVQPIVRMGAAPLPQGRAVNLNESVVDSPVVTEPESRTNSLQSFIMQCQ